MSARCTDRTEASEGVQMKPADELKDEANELFSEIEGLELKNKDRLKLPPQDMPNQDPLERIQNMNEVATGYYETQVRVEAARCLQCKNAPCIQGCPRSEEHTSNS